jgi:putative copper resistance protein D
VLVLADFLDTLLRGALLVGLALALGSVAWGLWVLRGLQPGLPEAIGRRCLVLLEAGAVMLALGQGLLLVLKAITLSDSLGPGALRDFVATHHFEAGAARAALAVALAAVARWLRRAPTAPGRWAVACGLAVLLAASGAWLTHANGRLEHRETLMTLTVLHQAAGAIWLGGLLQLGGLWRLARRDPGVDSLWPQLVARFSRMAMASVVVLVLGGVALAWAYTGSWRALFGTGYGSLVVTKALLLGVTLLLAAFNGAAARGGDRPGRLAALRARLPHLAEAEAIIIVMILFTTSALSAQPPSIDVPAAEQATVAEVVEVFRPKLPSLRTPSLEAMRQDRQGTDPDGIRSRDAYLWSNFSHNVAGLILLGMSLWALAGFVTGGAWGRHWPLGFIALAVFVFLRASANGGTWPFGTEPLSLAGSEGLQHRIAAVLVLAIGLVEWRARAGRRPGGAIAYIFPVLGAAGGILLLAHSHTAFELKPYFLVQITHSTMGAFAALMVVARWLELRMAEPSRRLAGAAASAALLAIALILVFYQEANVQLPPD